MQLGPRPFYLVDQMSNRALQYKLETCIADIQPYQHHDFSIGHRGVALGNSQSIPRMPTKRGAGWARGILECDVTFTKDGELVCRHAQCDLHTTTNILVTRLARTCRVPFTPAVFDDDGNRVKAHASTLLYDRYHLRAIQEAQGQDGCVQPECDNP